MANFNRTLAALGKDQIIIPVVRAALSDPDFQGFSVKVRGWRKGKREFDGKFHPSTHATWTTRQLALYLLHGDKIPSEPPSLLYVAAVTQGSFWHDFIQRLLLREGILVRNPGTTSRDSIEKQVEVPIEDPVHNLRGHADGRMAIRDGELFEFKTAHDFGVKKMTSENELRERHPGYYAQAQDYLMVTGASRMRYFVMGLSNPWPMQEFVVHANAGFQHQQKQKYREAIEMAKRMALPMACCSPGSETAKECAAKRVGAFCPVVRQGLAS